jgi:uncharacterized protein YecT (DUF1311 family)
MAIAQTLAVDDQTVQMCFSGAPIGDVRPDCLGAASNACQGQPGGATTIGITECIGEETDAWDGILNAQYSKVRTHFAEIGGDSLTTSLRDAQRAWIAFRDAECALQYDRWGGGSIRSIAYADCKMTMTASRAIELRDMVEGNP